MKKEMEMAWILCQAEDGQEISLRGSIHALRPMGEITFLILRRGQSFVQCVWEEGCKVLTEEEQEDGADAAKGRRTTEGQTKDRKALREEMAVEITGIVRKEPRAIHGAELRVSALRILSRPAEPMPLCINKGRVKASLETRLNLRSVTLRNPLEAARFRIQEGLVRGFRDYLHGQGFTEVHTPKLIAKGAEGGANIFHLQYFGQQAELAQSPQFYKQALVGVYDRVFEVGPVFRAEKHNTVRHLNEYVSMDLEMGYIDGFEDVMEMETGALKAMFRLLEEEYDRELSALGVEVPQIGRIPRIRFDEAKELAAQLSGRPVSRTGDLGPEEEAVLGRYFREQMGSDFVFVTHYPSRKRPFYAMDDPKDPRVTLSFDLLFRGLEVTTGGQRIHDYGRMMQKLEDWGMDPEELSSYLMIFRCGMPPHGGLGIGLERLTMKLLGEDNVREASLYPRDVKRLTP